MPHHSRGASAVDACSRLMSSADEIKLTVHEHKQRAAQINIWFISSQRRALAPMEHAALPVKSRLRLYRIELIFDDDDDVKSFG